MAAAILTIPDVVFAHTNVAAFAPYVDAADVPERFWQINAVEQTVIEVAEKLNALFQRLDDSPHAIYFLFKHIKILGISGPLPNGKISCYINHLCSSI